MEIKSICIFNIPHTSRAKMEERQTIFDFKNAECQKIFDDVSAGTAIFSALGDENISVEKRTQGFIQNLNELFMKTFRKIKIKKMLSYKNPIHEYMSSDEPVR